MDSMFEEKMCKYCRTTDKGSCKNNYTNYIEKNVVYYKCSSYKKDSQKISPYRKPLEVTAERDYKLKKER